MAFGYGIANWFLLRKKRIIELRPTFGLIGIVLLIAFSFLRGSNWGDPTRGASVANLFTPLSFVNWRSIHRRLISY